MKARDVIFIAIADTSVIVRSGLLATLKRFPKLNIQAVEVESKNALEDCISTQPLNILIINPFFEGFFNITKFHEQVEDKSLKVVALSTTYTDPNLLKEYDASITLFDSLSKIGDTIYSLMQRTNEEEEQESLTDREKEVVVCIVKGMTNKEIAESLYLSVHTVNTHRKNITRKLQIHSASGLTIYAIVNKLVDLNEIQAD